MMVIFLRGTPVSVSSWQEIDSGDIYFVIHVQCKSYKNRYITWQKCIYFSTLVIALYVPF